MRAPGGVVRTRTFDLLNRLTGETGTGAEEATDARTLKYNLAGLVVESSAPSGADVLTYNDRGALLTTDGPSGKSSFAYDANGRMSTRTDESGTSRYVYQQGRTTTLQDAITGTVRSIGYNEAGQVKAVGYGTDRTRSFTYDEYGRLKTDTLSGAGGVTAASTAYGYDISDRLTTKTTTGLSGSGTNSYEYDYSNRLTSWTFNGARTEYGWDDAGNRVRSGTETASYDARNRLQGDGDYTYKWSARGTLAARVSSGLEEKYGFDSFDRAVRNGDTRFAYDGRDRLSARNGKNFTYAGNSLDLVSDGESRFSRGADGSLLALGQGDQKRLTVSDSHGDLVGGFDPDSSLQSLTDSAAFDPFGQAMASVGAKRSLGFQGDYTDPASGDVDMGARWYSPGTGGFTARDSISLPSSPSGMANRYAYGLGAPTNFSDPDGHCPEGYTSYLYGADRRCVRNNDPTIPDDRGWCRGFDEVFQKGDGHAEETIINNLFSPNTGVQEWGIIEGGTSTGICWSNCYPDLAGNGISVGGPDFRSSEMNSPWRMFWSL